MRNFWEAFRAVSVIYWTLLSDMAHLVWKPPIWPTTADRVKSAPTVFAACFHICKYVFFFVIEVGFEFTHL